MTAKWLFLVLAVLSLGGCCVSGNGCAPSASSQPAWDGLGRPPAVQADGEPVARVTQTSRARAGDAQRGPGATGSDVTGAAPTKPFSPEWQAQERAEQDKLSRSMAICRNC